MPDHKAAYQELLRLQNKAISLLQEAQRKAEEMYIEAEPPKMLVFTSGGPGEVSKAGTENQV